MALQRIMNAARVAMAVVLCCTACGSGDTIDYPQPVDDIPLTVVDRASLENAPELELHERFTTSGGDIDDFTFVTGVALRNDTTYVTDEVANRVFVIDERGNVAFSFGGEGDGPGELRRPSAIAIGGDTVYVLDTHGLNRFNADGTFIDRATIDTRAAGGAKNYIPYPQGLHHTTAGLKTAFYQYTGARGNPHSDTLSWHVLNLDGVVAKPHAYQVSELVYEIRKGAYAQPLFMGRRELAITEDGTMYMTHQDGIDIDVLAADGTPARRVRLDVERRAVSDGDVAEYIAAVRAMPRQEWEASNTDRTRGLKRHPRAAYRNVAGPLVADGDRILVRRDDLTPIDGYSTEPSTWDMIGTDGSVLGRMRLPRRIQPRVLRDNILIGIDRDSMDVPHVIRYEIVQKKPDS